MNHTPPLPDPFNRDAHLSPLEKLAEAAGALQLRRLAEQHNSEQPPTEQPQMPFLQPSAGTDARSPLEIMATEAGNLQLRLLQEQYQSNLGLSSASQVAALQACGSKMTLAGASIQDDGAS